MSLDFRKGKEQEGQRAKKEHAKIFHRLWEHKLIICQEIHELLFQLENAEILNAAFTPGFTGKTAPESSSQRLKKKMEQGRGALSGKGSGQGILKQTRH